LKALPGTLHVIGTGPMESVWRSLAASLGVADRVVWRGRVSDDELVGTYCAATALWFPSNERSEGFGLVQVEAMACGCPVVNANIPHSGVPWVSCHDATGLTVSVNDPVAFAAAARLSHEAVLQAKLRFDAVQMAARSLEIYREAIAS
jgi:glycosyltransferase involved in cell wall biosynthesis